ncbi:TonB-dependent receptor plug domain-containing protein [Pseudoduganella sp. UC29_106]|uniref:TonB-dependent receptor plug domain-containing protein n=1 Tax=Pseudoduganella sp. UC29_106 TaxID=3374553 RepID=UPI003757790A
MNNNNIRSTLLFAALLARASTAAAQASDQFADLSLEELNDIVITSVSRQEERLSKAAASIFIISGVDIRRSGARTLPEALRLAPNLQVARLDAMNYAITARGYNTSLQNKLLVLIDGRPVYSPLFSGVFWDSQDVVMEDIERIEVISGPGATIWGVNAVNGVINVITRSAKDSQGTLASAVAGKEERDGTFRYGGKLGDSGHFRAYARYSRQEDTETEAGAPVRTGGQRHQAGFRGDWALRDGAFALSGDAYEGRFGQVASPDDTRVSGANLVGSYTRKLDAGSDLRLQLVLDHTERSQPGVLIDKLNTIEIEGQHGLRFGRHNIAWGVGYRYSENEVHNGYAVAFFPTKINLHWGNIFAQDEIALSDKVTVTPGAKVEHNNYTGAEFLPSVRLAWSPSQNQLIWGNVAHTVRAPSRVDRDLYLPGVTVPIAGLPRYVIGGGPDFKSETANVVELGYRAQPRADLTYSLTLFNADYDKLRTIEPSGVNAPNTGLYVLRNESEGRARGAEMWLQWQPASRWRLYGGLVLQDVETTLKPGSRDITVAGATNDPRSHWLLRSSHELPNNMQLDWTLRRMGRLPKPEVPAYHELDVHWLWRLNPNLDLSLIGQNLLHRTHAEFGALPGRSVFERNVLLKLTLRL